MKKMFKTIILIILTSSFVSQLSVVISSISLSTDTESSSRWVSVSNVEAVQQSAQNSPRVWLIADNITNNTMMYTNKTISGQYIVTLKDNVTHTPKALQDALGNLTAMVESSGAKVMYEYKYSLKGLAIKIPNQQILEKLLNDLRKDSRVATIEPDKNVQAF